MNNNNTSTPSHANRVPKSPTLAAISERKITVRKEMHESMQRIKSTYATLIAPPQTTTKAEKWMNMFDQGLAIYDGIRMGMRVVNTLKHFIPKRRK